MFKNKIFWEFAFKSMKRRLGFEILGRLFLAHPISSIKGLLKYQLSKKIKPDSFSHPLIIGAYCQKPLDCPAKRFNHRCLFAENLIIYPACKKCELREMVKMAIMFKSPFYIMTTALDVLFDVFLKKRFSYFLTTICPYAKQLFLFPALVFDMKGYFFLLGKGSCKSYDEFLLADKGYKKTQTFLSPLAKKRFMKIYDKINFDINNPLIFKGNFYEPQFS